MLTPVQSLLRDLQELGTLLYEWEPATLWAGFQAAATSMSSKLA